jgi:acyl carrier protein
MKNDQTISSRVRSIVAEALNLDSDEVHHGAVQEEFPEWDSMSYLTILSNIEDEFGVSVSEDNINKFGGISQITDEIKKCQKK